MEVINTEFDKALSLRDDVNMECAISILKELGDRYQDRPVIFVMIGFLLSEIEEYEQAISCSNRAVLLYPHSKRASLLLLHCLWDIGINEDALEEMKRFLKIENCEDYNIILEDIKMEMRQWVD